MSRRLLPLLLAAGLLSGPAAARSLIKVATLVPEGSVWHEVFAEMTREVEGSTGGDVQVRLYPGGVAGDEPDMVRKMRIGQLHGAVLTVAGLAEIEKRFSVFSVPLLIRDYEELWYLMEQLEPELSAALEERGFRFVHWGGGGWVQLFSRRPVRRIDDLKKVKFFVWAGDDRMVKWWQRNGFHPVALAATDVMTGLQTGMIDGLPTTPLAALTLQWYRMTPQMLELGLGPLIGATVVTEAAWKKLSPAERNALLEAGEKAEAKLRDRIPQKDAEAIEQMKARGLTVNPVEELESWHATGEAMARSMRESMDPTALETLDRAIELLASFRRGGSP